jgi:hypothetical protein
VQWIFAYTPGVVPARGRVRPVFELRRQRCPRVACHIPTPTRSAALTHVHPLAWVGAFLSVTWWPWWPVGWLLARWLLPE